MSWLRGQCVIKNMEFSYLISIRVQFIHIKKHTLLLKHRLKKILLNVIFIRESIEMFLSLGERQSGILSGYPLQIYCLFISSSLTIYKTRACNGIKSCLGMCVLVSICVCLSILCPWGICSSGISLVDNSINGFPIPRLLPVFPEDPLKWYFIIFDIRFKLLLCSSVSGADHPGE